MLKKSSMTQVVRCLKFEYRHTHYGDIKKNICLLLPCYVRRVRITHLKEGWLVNRIENLNTLARIGCLLGATYPNTPSCNLAVQFLDNDIRNS